MSTEIKPEAIRDQDEAISLSYWLAEKMGEHVDDQGDETLTETVQRYVSREWMPKTGANPTLAPLDPSKVKAGDTVTLESGTALVRDVVIEAKSRGVGQFVFYTAENPDPLIPGTYYLVNSGAWTLAGHQPAPEPEPEWKPGTVGTAGTVRGLTYTGPVVRADNPVMPWWTPAYIGGAHWHREADVTDFVPDEPRAVWSRQGLRAALVHSDSLKTDPGTGMTYIDPDLATERLAAYMRGESR